MEREGKIQQRKKRKSITDEWKIELVTALESSRRLSKGIYWE